MSLFSLSSEVSTVCLFSLSSEDSTMCLFSACFQKIPQCVSAEFVLKRCHFLLSLSSEDSTTCLCLVCFACVSIQFVSRSLYHVSVEFVFRKFRLCLCSVCHTCISVLFVIHVFLFSLSSEVSTMSLFSLSCTCLWSVCSPCLCSVCLVHVCSVCSPCLCSVCLVHVCSVCSLCLFSLSCTCLFSLFTMSLFSLSCTCLCSVCSPCLCSVCLVRVSVQFVSRNLHHVSVEFVFRRYYHMSLLSLSSEVSTMSLFSLLYMCLCSVCLQKIPLCSPPLHVSVQFVFRSLHHVSVQFVVCVSLFSSSYVCVCSVCLQKCPPCLCSVCLQKSPPCLCSVCCTCVSVQFVIRVCLFSLSSEVSTMSVQFVFRSLHHVSIQFVIHVSLFILSSENSTTCLCSVCLWKSPPHVSVPQVEAYPRPDIFRIISEDAQGRRQLEVKGNSWTVNTMTESTHPFLTTFELRMPNLTPQYFDRTYYLEIENSEGKKTLAFLLRERGTVLLIIIIQYKINTLCYNCVTGTAPSYICDCLQLSKTWKAKRHWCFCFGREVQFFLFFFSTE